MTEPEARSAYKTINVIVGEIIREANVEVTPRIRELLDDLGVVVLHCLAEPLGIQPEQAN